MPKLFSEVSELLDVNLHSLDLKTDALLLIVQTMQE